MTPFGLAGASEGMVGRCMPKYGHGGTPGTPFMIIFGIYVSTPIPNIETFQIYEVYKSWKVSHLFSHQISIFFLIKFPVEWHQNHVWKPIFDPSYDHFYKCEHFG